jgi:hypothetical protein
LTCTSKGYRLGLKGLTMNNQSVAAIEVLRSWVDFSTNSEENKEIEATIKFLESILKYSYGEILKKLK